MICGNCSTIMKIVDTRYGHRRELDIKYKRRLHKCKCGNTATTYEVDRALFDLVVVLGMNVNGLCKMFTSMGGQLQKVKSLLKGEL